MKNLTSVINRIIGRVERLLASPWFNPLQTIYLNLRSLPLKDAIKIPIYVYGNIKIHSLSGKIRFECPIKPGLVKLGYPAYGICLNPTRTNIKNMGEIVFQGEAKFCNGVSIYVMEGLLKIGDRCLLAENVKIACEKLIEIGTGTRISHESQIIDTNSHFLMDVYNKTVMSQKGSIIIGEWCWIANRCTVQKGTILPNNIIVTSNSLLNKQYIDLDDCSIVGGTPAKKIKVGVRRVFKKESELALKKFFNINGDGSLYKETKLSVEQFCN